MAIRLDSEESLCILLQNDNISIERALDMASSEGSPKIVSLLLENPTISPKDVLGCIRIAAGAHRVLALQVLLEDARANGGRVLVAELLSETYNRRVLSCLAKSRQVVLSDLKPDTLKRTLDACVSPLETDIIQQLLPACNDYIACHYSMLLREVVMKKRDIGYYIDWIAEQMRQANDLVNSQHMASYLNLSRVMINAIDSLKAESVMHTSDIFTAYRGFLLLSQTKSFEDIYNILSSEKGTTSHGISLAIDLVRWLTN